MRTRMLILAVLVAGSGAFSSFAAAADDQNTREVLWPTKSWQTSSPEEQGMDSASLARLIEAVGQPVRHQVVTHVWQPSPIQSVSRLKVTTLSRMTIFILAQALDI
jgi:hypothetical protein